jgi:hypothetical protein
VYLVQEIEIPKGRHRVVVEYHEREPLVVHAGESPGWAGPRIT